MPLGAMNVVVATLEVSLLVSLIMGYGGELPVSSLGLDNCHSKYFFPIVGGGDQGYGSGRYDNRPGAYGFGYGYGYGRSRDYGGRWVTNRLVYAGASSLSLRTHLRDLSGGPVAKTLYSQCRGPGINPWSGQ